MHMSCYFKEYEIFNFILPQKTIIIIIIIIIIINLDFATG